MIKYDRNGVFMRIIVIILLVFISLLSNDKGMLLNHELKVLEYQQNQIIHLHSKIADIDTKNELLEVKVIENEKYYQKILEN